MTAHRRIAHLSALLVVALALLSLVGVGPASAKGTHLGEVPVTSAAETYGPGIWHHAPEGRTWYGAYRTFPDVFAYCIDAGKQTPLVKHFADAKPVPVTAPQTAWALHTYADSDSADVQAALSAIARDDDNLDHDHAVPPRDPGDLGKRFAGAAKEYATITEAAERFAGPYTLEVSLAPVLDMPVLEPYDEPDETPGFARKPATPKDPLFPPTGEVTLTVSLTSASGASVPDIPIELEVTGADGAPATLTSGTAPVGQALEAKGPGTVRATASATVAPDTVLLYEPTSGERVQRVITPDEPTEVSADASVDLTSAPRVTTEISDAAPTPGTEVTDEFTVSGLVGDHTVTVVHELWSTAVKPEIGKKNDDAEVIGTVTSKNIGNGTHRSGPVRIPEDVRGWVYFTETIAADAMTKEWKGIHGQPKETGFAPWTPSAQTTAELAGSRVHDEVAVSGLRPGAEAKLTITAYHLEVEPQQSAKPAGTEIDSQDITVVADQEGTATVSTEAIDMPTGWVTFVTTIHRDDVHRGWTSEWGIPAETVHRPPEEKPAVPPAPPTTPPPPEQPTQPPAPPQPPEQPTQPPAPPQPPVSSPPAAPVAEQPQAPAPADELPRTGSTGTGLLIGAGIVLIGVGAATLLITGRRRR